MSDFPEAIGGATEGALLARAVEPAHGKPDGHTREGACLNCGTALIGSHCHVCGQRAHVHRTIGAFLHDLVHGALHFEGKIWHTLPLLAWRPGALTRRYIEGERARFVSPMALFLFSVFLMFAVFQAAGITAPTEFSPEVIGPEVGQAGEEGALAGLREARKNMDDSNPAAGMLDVQIARLETQQEQSAQGADAPPATGDSSFDGAWFRQAQVRTGAPFLDRAIEKWQENPGLMAYKLQANSYKFSWLLIPLSIPFVWLIFAWRRQFRGYDHAVFVTYSLSFMTLLFVALTMLGLAGLGGGWIFTLATTIPIWHIYRQLKGAYDLSRFSAVWRTIVLLGFITLILLSFLNVLLLLGALG